MSWWDKDWVRGLTHVALAIGTAGASVPLSAAYEGGRYMGRKYADNKYADGYLAGANSAKKDDGDSASAGSTSVVYDGALAETELEKRKKKSQSLIDEGSSTFSGGALGA